MLFGSLFSGIGGLDLGLERAGMECAWQVEVDPFCQRILEKHWPDVQRFRDVGDCSRRNLSPVDLLCGGFPCQPVSYAGKRQGALDERWLWPQFYRIICELEPEWVLVENVPGLLSIDAGRLFAGILRDLAELGYDAEWSCVPAAAFGAPHLRWRVFMVAYTRSQRQSGQCDLSGRLPQAAGGGKIVADAMCKRRNGRPRVFKAAEQAGEFSTQGSHAWWALEPTVGRMAHGIPDRVDRLASIGRSVVPQVAEWLGRCIIEADQDL